jgi:hypothetical protein
MSRGRDVVSYAQQLLTTAKGDWTSLVVVPATPGLSGRIVAEALAEVCGLVRGKAAKLFAAEGLEVQAVSKLVVELTEHVSDGGLAVVSIDSVLSRQAGVPVLLWAERALLVVHLGVTKLDDAKKTAQLVGETKLLGAVTLEPAKR